MQNYKYGLLFIDYNTPLISKKIDIFIKAGSVKKLIPFKKVERSFVFPRSVSFVEFLNIPLTIPVSTTELYAIFILDLSLILRKDFKNLFLEFIASSGPDIITSFQIYGTNSETYNCFKPLSSAGSGSLSTALIESNQTSGVQKTQLTNENGDNLQINPDGSLNVNTDSPNSDALLQTIISNQSSTANSDFLLQTIIDNQTNGNQYTQIPNPLEVFGNINVNQPIEVFGNINVNQPINVNVINDRLPDVRLRDDNGDRLDINPDGSINVNDNNTYGMLINIMGRLNEFTFNVADGTLKVKDENSNILYKYRQVRRDTATLNRYFGYEDIDGEWYVKLDDITFPSNQFILFARGSGGLAASGAWNNRASLTYNEFNVQF